MNRTSLLSLLDPKGLLICLVPRCKRFKFSLLLLLSHYTGAASQTVSNPTFTSCSGSSWTTNSLWRRWPGRTMGQSLCPRTWRGITCSTTASPGEHWSVNIVGKSRTILDYLEHCKYKLSRRLGYCDDSPKFKGNTFTAVITKNVVFVVQCPPSRRQVPQHPGAHGTHGTSPRL